MLVGGTVDSFAADYASKLTFSLSANQETNVVIPGLNAIVSLMLVADNLVNISLGEESGVAIYDGTDSRQVSKFYGTNGITYDHIKIKASTLAAKVTLVIVGKAAT